ncbi:MULTISPECIES: MBL fold metallo-hydrolase [Glycomyces]|uniref:L-ascorbate metabolism protein UlaG (Beta-lactamase superfamily) n=2 Tax=Glycomyces TaxID=58113 RepID=A0A9X3PH64_9ACTN|nr:MBL fold metallo-hydrolase [Glycomyces lechevalierae]MDA1383628.1 MBL fold metallo-hydrolase [Glycomyces lechevalierae]MDR7341382.1 L-ascorbate metabolism protein UlaG (beta-lactamase superfamily) [Glycomyces lechevalierae]
MTSEVTVRWLGTNAWEITCDGATVLVDPYVSRTYTGATKPGEFNPDTPIAIDEAAIDEHIGAADSILITHAHFDHIADVPYVAEKTGATVLGTETHLNLLRAMDTPEEQLSQVGGGELYQFEGYTVEVFRSSHGVTGKHKSLLFPGTRPGETPARPEVIKDLVEGGSLAYLVTFGEVSLFFNGVPSFHERELGGITPTVLFMQGPNPNYPNYVERMLAATGFPPYVVPTHWDDYEAPLTEPAVDLFGAEKLGELVAEAGPDSQWVLLDHLESYTFTG